MSTLFQSISLALALAFGAAMAGPASADGGPVILTVSGAVEKPNRGAVDPAVDKFFEYNEAEFQEATEFDYGALQALDFVKAKADFPKDGEVQEFEGPLLADVLAAAGAKGETITLTALDGYAIEAKIQDMVDRGAVLALRRNGEPFAVGDFGPSQIVFPRAERADLKDMPDDEWIWSIYHIKVE